MLIICLEVAVIYDDINHTVRCRMDALSGGAECKFIG